MTKVKTLKLFALLICIVLVIAAFTRCGAKRPEDQIIGSWYQEGRSKPYFTFYNDGTCYASGRDGTWNIVDGNQLHVKRSGELVVLTIDSIKDGCLTLSYEGKPISLWNSPR